MMTKEPELTHEIQCIRVEGVERRTTPETVAAESDLAVFLNGEHIDSFSCSPEYIEEMIMGHLLATGRIGDIMQIESIRVLDNSEAHVQLIPDVENLPHQRQGIEIDSRLLHHMRDMLLRSQQYQQVTRGFHAAEIMEPDTERIFACEDISRHSAMDKVIGMGAKMGLDLGRSILMVTGRLVSAIVQKAANSGIPLLASLTVATDSGIDVARAHDITLVGSLTESGFWLYNEGEAEITMRR